MALESNNNNSIPLLDTANPSNFDLINEGDDHIRMIKRVLKTTFAKIDKPLQIDSDGINNIAANIAADTSSITIKNAVNGAAGKTWDLKTGYLTGIKTSAAVASGAGLTSKDAVNVEYLYNHAAFAAYPVGSLFFTTTTGNPRDLLKMAGTTWSQFGGGRVIMGVGSGTDAKGQGLTVANGGQGGFYKVSLSNDEGPRHSHTVLDHAVTVDLNAPHNHRFGGDDGIGGMGFRKVQGVNYDARSHGGDGGIFLTSDEPGHNHTAWLRGASTNVQGAGAAHENTQPYIAVFIWKRET